MYHKSWYVLFSFSNNLKRSYVINFLFISKGTFKTRMSYCICDNKDGCNSSTKLKNDFILSYKWIFVIFSLLFKSIQLEAYFWIFFENLALYTDWTKVFKLRTCTSSISNMGCRDKSLIINYFYLNVSFRCLGIEFILSYRISFFLKIVNFLTFVLSCSFSWTSFVFIYRKK